MKTIALSEKASSRLASWRIDRDETFSEVIERLIPPKGTLRAALEAAGSLPDPAVVGARIPGQCRECHPAKTHPRMEVIADTTVLINPKSVPILTRNPKHFRGAPELEIIGYETFSV